MKRMNLPIRILWNFAPALLWLCLFPMGLWAALPMAFLQAAIAFLNFKYSSKPLATALLGIELMVASAVGCFFSGIFYVALISEGIEFTTDLAILFLAELGYTLLLTILSTLARWRGKNRARHRRIVLMVGGAMIGIACGSLISMGEIPIPHGKWSLPLFLLGLLLSLVLVTFLHELGHLLMGGLAGYRFYGFRLGALNWKKENGRLAFRFQRTPGISGACLMLPPSEGVGRWRQLIMVAGGVSMNLATGLPALLLPIGGGIGSAADLFGVLSLLSALLNAVPFYSMGNPTDGKQFWSLLLRTKEGGHIAATNRLSVLLQTGTRPRELEPLPPLSEHPKGAELLSRLSGDYFRLLDAGDLEGAGETLRVLEAHIASFPSAALPALDYERCFYACIMGDKPRAEELYAGIRMELDRDKDMNGMRVKAYCAWYLDGDEVAARRDCLQALKVGPLFPVPGQAALERDLVEKLLSILPK